MKGGFAMSMTIKLISKTTIGGVTRYQFDVGKGEGLDDNQSTIYQAGLKIERDLRKLDSRKTAIPDQI
jgi:hypothetical protein